MSTNGRKFRNGGWRCRQGGETFAIVFKKTPKSPFDILGVKTKATTKDILEHVYLAGIIEKRKDSESTVDLDVLIDAEGLTRANLES